ncbi:MAG: RadC family protein [Caulobacterales bacterium]|uniref:RadC family protein n=1 Tax=Glycocaulis sp. TaxID=1969725 RepID=UPI003F9FEEF6
MRARFAEAGGKGLADYEILELVLFRSIPQRDVKPLAKALLARFGDLGRVCAARPDQLTEIKGVSDKVALDLNLMQEMATRISREQIAGRAVISSWSALLDYVRTALQNASTEEFRVLFLDKKNRLLADEFQASGTVDHAPVYPREVIKRAIALDASALILVHNHPSGDPTPSHADIEMTRQVIDIGRPLSIVVHDHLVVGRDKVASFKQLGLM